MFATRSRFTSIQQKLDPHVITRQVHIRTHRCPAWQPARVLTTSASLNQCARHCHQVARAQQWECVCNGADDADDPPCTTSADTVCGVEITGETSTVACQATLTFFSCSVSYQIPNVTCLSGASPGSCTEVRHLKTWRE